MLSFELNKVFSAGLCFINIFLIKNIIKIESFSWQLLIASSMLRQIVCNRNVKHYSKFKPPTFPTKVHRLNRTTKLFQMFASTLHTHYCQRERALNNYPPCSFAIMMIALNCRWYSRCQPKMLQILVSAKDPLLRLLSDPELTQNYLTKNLNSVCPALPMKVARTLSPT